MVLCEATDDDDQSTSASAAQELLAHAMGVPGEIPTRLAVTRGAGKDDGELPLRGHFYEAFRVSGMRRSAASRCEIRGALPGH